MTDKFEVFHTDEIYDVEIRVVRKAMEFVGVTDYKNMTRAASVPTVSEREVECVHFSHEDKELAVKRAIEHLKIIGDAQ